MTEDNLSYCRPCFIMYKNTESVGQTPETWILASYNSKNFNLKKAHGKVHLKCVRFAVCKFYFEKKTVNKYWTPVNDIELLLALLMIKCLKCAYICSLFWNTSKISNGLMNR